MSANLQNHVYPEVVQTIKSRMEIEICQRNNYPTKEKATYGSTMQQRKSRTQIFESFGPIINICTTSVKHPIIACPRHPERMDNRPRYDFGVSQRDVLSS